MNTRIKLAIILILLLNQFILIGQDKKQNSYSLDTARISEIIIFCEKNIYNNPEITEKYTDTLLILSKKYNYDFGFFNTYNLKAAICYMGNNTSQALDYYKLALEYTSSKDPKNRAMLLGNIGMIYTSNLMTDSAIYFLKETIEYSTKNNIFEIQNKALYDLSSLYIRKNNYVQTAINLLKVEKELILHPDTKLTLFMYNSLGLLYTKTENFDLALSSFKKAIDWNKNVPQINYYSQVYLNIGELYFSLKQNYDSALFYYRKAIDYALPNEKPSIELSSWVNQGNVFTNRYQFDSAIFYYQKAYNNSEINNDPSNLAAVLINMGNYYLNTNNLKKADEFLNSGYEICENFGLLQFKKNALLALSQLDSIKGDFAKSLKHYKAYHEISDSIQQLDAKNKLAILDYEKYVTETKFNNALLTRDNELQNKRIENQRKVIFLFLLGALFLIIILSTLFINRSKIKRLLNQLSGKHKEILAINEELETINETLKVQKIQLHNLNSTKDKFFSIISHDLKNPFNSLLGLLGFLNEDWEQFDDKKKQELIKSLYESSEKTYELLENLLTWGKIQQDMIQCKKELFLVSPIISKIVDLFKVQISKKDLVVDIEIDSNLELKTDSRIFSQIIQNILNNAIKYTYHKGNIVIKAEIIHNEIYVSISDTGIGIPKDKIPTLFEIDSKFNRPGTDKELSTGMGLILIKEYSEILGARLSVDSIEERGSTFSIIFQS